MYKCIYYINGEEVTRVTAWRFFSSFFEGGNFADQCWLGKYYEEGRELIAGLTNGALEIVIK
jgi:hypothetical protein